ncbi:tRNA wybutosine-synthesizing protein 3 homolog [Brachionichthys hirsutus]|uniref:tRNA wybutosine-synthesizing protein 3 homolog n=1 Tax=Brachionichthys hirsutus TaxID=412623 RepID=UPI0036044407
MFGRWKTQCLNKLDLSRKGSVDGDIQHVVSLLNGREQFFTTSSCAGRVVLIERAPEERDIQKQNCVWLFVSHQKCDPDDLVSALAGSGGSAVLRFEPLVLHVQCRRLDDAQLLHAVAVNSGFRNSGLTFSKTGKIITAVRSTHGMEVPLSCQGKLLVEHEYIHFLAQVANQKMEENLKRIGRFYQNLQSALSAGKLQKLQVPDSQDPPPGLETKTGLKPEYRYTMDKMKTSVYKRRRRRERDHQTDCSGNDSSFLPESRECLAPV